MLRLVLGHKIIAIFFIIKFFFLNECLRYEQFADFVPADESAHIAVVDVDVGYNLTAHVLGIENLFGMLVVHGVECNPVLFAELNSTGLV